MFTRSAHLYDAIYTSIKNYEREAERLHSLIQDYVPGAETLLDVACGTGLHLKHLASHYEVAGVDLDPEMLEIARQRLPRVDLTLGGMTSFELGRTFDAVTCLFSSVGYLLSRKLLKEAIANMTRHLRPGGVLILEPWITPDRWEPTQPEAIFVDRPGMKIARMSRAERRGNLSTVVFHYLVATKDGIEYFTERHEGRLHSHDEYLAAMKSARLAVEFNPEGLMGRGLYTGHRRAG